jgi:hypothetical protein
MKRLAYLTAMALLGIGLTLAQNTQSTKPSSDPSNSSNNTNQAQSDNATPQQGEKDQIDAPSAKRRGSSESSKDAVPNPTVQDQQNDSNSAGDASGQKTNQPSPSTMGTTGSTPPSADDKQPPASEPGATPPPDQQPNSSTGPGTVSPHAALMQTPMARAVATHTPDPGTCMNPEALETTADGTQPAKTRCR